MKKAGTLDAIKEIKLITAGNYQLNSSNPLSQVLDLKKLISNYYPTQEEMDLLKAWDIERINKWESDLRLGLKK